MISATRDSGIEINKRPTIDWGAHIVRTIIRMKLGKRIVFGFIFTNPFKLEAGTYEVSIDTSEGNCTADLEVK